MSCLVPAICLLVCFVYASADCLDGWTRFDDSCYRLFKNGLKWSLAVFECEKKDAFLAVLDTSKKIQNVHALMVELNGDGDDRYWIGLTDVRVEGEWVWENTGKNATVMDWAKGEPNQHGTSQQDCVMLYGATDFGWADDNCNTAFGYLCERPLSSP